MWLISANTLQSRSPGAASLPEGSWQHPRSTKRPARFRRLAAAVQEGQWAPDLQRTRVLAVTDLHVDYSENMEWTRRISGEEHKRDVLIVAGDVSDDLALLEEALGELASKFGAVFYTHGNHELWIRSPLNGHANSTQKLDAIWELCARLGVHTQPHCVGGRVWVVPILSWHHKSFDAEPDIPGIPPVSRLTIADYTACKWPSDALGFGEGQGGIELAEWFDDQNDPGLWEAVLSSRGDCDVISFSHFLPSQALLPEKRFLYYPGLPKAVGSLPLGRRVRQLRPDIHVFGHTHFAWDATIDGVRYIQAPLCSPLERKKRLFTVGFESSMAQAQADPIAASWLPVQVYECLLPADALPVSGSPGSERSGSSSLASIVLGSGGGSVDGEEDEAEVASIDHALHGIVTDEEDLPLDNPLAVVPCGSESAAPGSSPDTQAQTQQPAAGSGAVEVPEAPAAVAAVGEAAAAGAASPSEVSGSDVLGGEGATWLRHGWMSGPLGAHWSQYYDRHPRDPDCMQLAPWVARVYAKRLARRAKAEGAAPASLT